MAPHLAPILAGLLFVASPGADPGSNDDAVPLTNAEMLSAAAGGILGAAAMCGDISNERLTAATGKVALLVSASVNDDDELTSAQQMFAANAGVGKAAVESGRADCRTVEASLTKLEQLAEGQDEDQ
jgi:hypothetical protein